MSKAQKFTFFNNLAKFHSPYFYLNIHLAKITLYIMVLSNRLAKSLSIQRSHPSLVVGPQIEVIHAPGWRYPLSKYA